MDVLRCLLEFYALATSKVVSGWVLTCDSAHSWSVYSAGPLCDEATSNMTLYRTQSHYPDMEPTNKSLSYPKIADCFAKNGQASMSLI